VSALSFARPEWLWGLLLAAVPVLIHLIHRRRARRQPFAALDFLLRVQRRQARRLLLRQIVLLLLRTLAVVLAVLAAAGPSLQPPAREEAPGPRATILLLDTSFSMRYAPGGRSLFDRARELARREIRDREPGECLGLVTTGAPDPRIWSPCRPDGESVMALLDRIEVTAGGGELGPALQEAARLLEPAGAPRRRIVVFSDLAAHALGREPVWPGEIAPELELAVLLPADAERGNRAVRGVEARPERRHLWVNARIQNFSRRDETAVPVRVVFDAEGAVSGFADLPARQEVAKSFRPPRPAGGGVGRVVLPPDDLSDDDQEAFWAGEGGAVSLLLVDGDARPAIDRDELYFLERALAPDGAEGSGIGYRSVPPERLREEDLAGVQGVVLANVGSLPPALVESLRRFVRSGGGLLVAVGDQMDPQRASQELGDLLVRPLRDVISLGRTGDGPDETGMAFAAEPQAHPLLAPPGSEEALDLTRVRTEKAMVTEPGGGDDARVVLHFENGVPALLERSVGRGRLLLWTTSVDRDWTRWPARASFVPFWQRMCFYLAGRLGRPAPPRIESGQPVRLAEETDRERLVVVRPDGESVPLAEGQRRFEDTARLGWYHVRTQDGSAPLEAPPGFTVVPPPAESDLAPIEAERLSGWAGAAPLRWRAGGREGRRSLAVACFGFLLLILLAEAWLIRRG